MNGVATLVDPSAGKLSTEEMDRMAQLIESARKEMERVMILKLTVADVGRLRGGPGAAPGFGWLRHLIWTLPWLRRCCCLLAI